jgi:hypothetical protein
LTASAAVSEPSVPTTIRSNKSDPPYSLVRQAGPGVARILSGRVRMPPTWKYMMVVLVACLIASMVIAIVRLF